MAAAVRLTTEADSGAAYVGFGAFGRRVSAQLAEKYRQGRVHQPDSVEEAFASASSMVVAVFWRPGPAWCEHLDELAFRYRRPWLPVIVDHPVVRVGPVVGPASGVCFRCYRRRGAQHDLQYGTTSVLHAAYDRDDSLGPVGFLPQHVRLVAGVTSMLMKQAAAAEGTDGSVVTVRMLGHEVSVSRVTAFGDCLRCRGGQRVQSAIVPVLRAIRGPGQEGRSDNDL